MADGIILSSVMAGRKTPFAPELLQPIIRIRGGIDVFVPPACSQDASMKLKFIIVIIAIAMPLSAQAQKTGAAKVTKADVEKGRQDHQRRQGQDADYYDMANLNDQIE